jgi:hypothetical protein
MPNTRQDESQATGFKAVDKAADAAEAAARETSEAALKEGRAFTERAAATAREATDQASRAAAATFGIMEQATPDPAAVSRATEAVAARMQDLSSEWVQAFRDQTAKNLEGFSRLAACRSPLDFMRVQSELAREGLSDSVALARRLNTASLRTLGAIAQDSVSATQPRKR